MHQRVGRGRGRRRSRLHAEPGLVIGDPAPPAEKRCSSPVIVSRYTANSPTAAGSWPAMPTRCPRWRSQAVNGGRTTGRNPRTSIFLSIAGFGPIVPDRSASRTLYEGVFGIRFKEEDGGYLHTESLEGAKTFALWPLSQAAQSCFGTESWPSDTPSPQAWLELDVEDVEQATAELEQQGYRMLVKNKKEPWGQDREPLPQSGRASLSGIAFTLLPDKAEGQGPSIDSSGRSALLSHPYDSNPAHLTQPPSPRTRSASASWRLRLSRHRRHPGGIRQAIAREVRQYLSEEAFAEIRRNPGAPSSSPRSRAT